MNDGDHLTKSSYQYKYYVLFLQRRRETFWFQQVRNDLRMCAHYYPHSSLPHTPTPLPNNPFIDYHGPMEHRLQLVLSAVVYFLLTNQDITDDMRGNWSQPNFSSVKCTTAEDEGGISARCDGKLNVISLSLFGTRATVRRWFQRQIAPGVLAVPTTKTIPSTSTTSTTARPDLSLSQLLW